MDSGSDLRIPIFFGVGTGEAADAWLVEAGAAMPPEGYAVRFALPQQQFGHAIGCSCCTLRGPAADALTRMFQDRATGAAPYFKRVIVLASTAGCALVREALAQDAVTRARYVSGEGRF
jgi:hypothetical protein